MSGGQAIENAAKKATDSKKFFYEPILTQQRNCQFTFSGLCSTTISYINRQEKEFNIDGNALIPDVYNICAAVQLAFIKHMCLRTQRAMEFIDNTNVISQERRTLVSL
jgi:N6-L-threonylcarbamoyladenine synthase